MLGKVPEGWKQAQLGDCFSVKSSKRVLQKQWRKEGVPFYRGREITSLAEDGFVNNELFIEHALYEEFSSKHGVPHCGDILITAIGTIGNTYVVRDGDEFYFKDASVLWLERASENLSALVNYWFQSDLFFNQLDVGNGTTVDSLTISKLKSISIALPPLNEQHRIAEIVGSVDVSIQATRAVIEQAERVKRGLMEELLTGGLGIERVEGGEVPEGWQLLPLGDFARIRNGFAFKSKEFLSDDAADEDVPLVVRMSDFNGGYVDTRHCKRIKKTTADGLEKFRLKQGDILVAMSGATVGKLGRVPETSSELYLNQRVGCMQPTRCSGEFLWQLVNTPFFQATVLAAATGNAQPNISSKELEKIQFALPPVDTQNHIVSALTTFDDFIAKHKVILEQQTRTKRGLLNDLLTGKVRTV